MRVIKPWHRLPREMVQGPSLETAKGKNCEQSSPSLQAMEWKHKWFRANFGMFSVILLPDQVSLCCHSLVYKFLLLFKQANGICFWSDIIWTTFQPQALNVWELWCITSWLLLHHWMAPVLTKNWMTLGGSNYYSLVSIKAFSKNSD